jgi:hypothetical protein
MKKKDKRYAIVKRMINYGATTTFTQILEIIPKTVLTNDLGMHAYTFDKLMKDTGRFALEDIYKMASIIGIDDWKMLELFLNEKDKPKKAARKKKK